VLKTLIYIGIGLAGLFVLACAALIVLMVIIVVTTPKDKDGNFESRFVRSSDIEPPQDDTLFNRLANEAMAYATRPYVTTLVEVNGIFLLHTVSDVFGRRVYAESRRRVGKALAAVICVYEDGKFVPVATAATEIPAARVDWPAHFNAISDVTTNGPLVRYTDHRGRRRELRIPKRGGYRA